MKGISLYKKENRKENKHFCCESAYLVDAASKKLTFGSKASVVNTDLLRNGSFQRSYLKIFRAKSFQNPNILVKWRNMASMSEVGWLQESLFVWCGFYKDQLQYARAMKDCLVCIDTLKISMKSCVSQFAVLYFNWQRLFYE